MAIFSTVKYWQTETPGENLFLYLYNIALNDIKVEIAPQSWINSNHTLSEFFRLVAAIDLTHRCFNLGVKCIPDITTENITRNLRELVEFNQGKNSIRELAELVRLAVLAYQNQKLSKGTINSVYRTTQLTCCWCGDVTPRDKTFSPKSKQASVEHLWPEFLGGTSQLNNLTVACKDCNSKRKHAISWAWFGIQSYYEKLDENNSIPKEIKLAIGFHRLIKVASGQTNLSKNIITLKEASIRLRGIIPNITLKPDQRYTFLDFLNSASE